MNNGWEAQFRSDLHALDGGHPEPFLLQAEISPGAAAAKCTEACHAQQDLGAAMSRNRQHSPSILPTAMESLLSSHAQSSLSGGEIVLSFRGLRLPLLAL